MTDAIAVEPADFAAFEREVDVGQGVPAAAITRLDHRVRSEHLTEASALGVFD